MLTSKILHLKQIYKFYFVHFLVKCTVFVLIENTLLKIKKTEVSGQTSKIVHLKEIYNFDFDHFLIKCTVFVLIVKNVIKSQQFNFLDKLYDIRKKF